MSILPTPKVADLDDPLAPRREPPPTAPPASAPTATPHRRTATKHEPQPTTAVPPATPTDRSPYANDALVAVFARMPEGLSDRLADVLRALNDGRPRRSRVNQQDLLATLVDRYATPDDVTELSVHVDDYRRRLHV